MSLGFRFRFEKLYFNLCVSMFCLPACMFTMCVVIGSLGSGVLDCCGCWESNTGPLQEQVLLTTERSLQSPPPSPFNHKDKQHPDATLFLTTLG